MGQVPARANPWQRQDRPLQTEGSGNCNCGATAKEEAGPSPIRALRVWAQDDNEKKRRERLRQKADPGKPKGPATAHATATAGQLRRKKQVPHPSALRAYRLRMTRKEKAGTTKAEGRPLQTKGSGTRKGYIKTHLRWGAQGWGTLRSKKRTQARVLVPVTAGERLLKHIGWRTSRGGRDFDLKSGVRTPHLAGLDGMDT